MKDYMTALHQRFFQKPDFKELKGKIELSRQKVRDSLEKVQRRKLMQLVDAQAFGEGSIRKRKDGRWEGRYTAGHDPETGKAIYKDVLGKVQAEVKEKLKQAIGEAQALDVTKAGKYTAGEWMEVWFQDYAKIKVLPSSHQTYQGYIYNHIRPNI